ncbi:MAG TPA: FHA domain-containing protein [Anaerolineaceae bacterium]|nr:FHA domain-containing protein [Anaerolineaceae bacterium]
MAGPSYQLVMQSGPNQGKVAPLEKSEIFLGRDLSNDVVINDAEISRRHARLVLQAGGYVLEDLGSTNGTTVNGQRLMGPYILRAGDMITLGEHVNMVFEEVAFDPDATVAAAAFRPQSPQTAAVAPPPPPPVAANPSQASASASPPQSSAYQPPHPAPPPPAYSGQVPSGPSQGVAEPKRRSPLTVILIVLGILLLIACVCGGVFYYIDANNMWCRFFPFIPGCP